jgi:AmmeMemoRadiSam system protein A
LALVEATAAVEPSATQLEDPVFKVHGGTFVTLNLDGKLRGCIGILVGREPLVESVRHNALNAAFCDPRFRPVSTDEFSRLQIEVSVLTVPQALSFKDGADLVAKLRPGVDGVILRQGVACATFLPQVWEQLPRPEEFLSHLCLKACLSANAWRQTDIGIETYQAQVFEEADRR